MSPLPLVGRAMEVARLDELLAGAAAGDGRALVLDGPPGAGKTRLLEEATRLGDERGFDVRHAVGRRAEQHVDGAIVSQLTGVHDTTPPRVHDAVCAAAAHRPVLLAIDDAHLGDQASMAAVAYVARRLVGRSVAVLMAFGAERAPAGGVSGRAVDEVLDDVLDGVERLHLHGLAPEGLAALFERVAGALDDQVAARVAELTGGNPLAVIEFARGSTAEQRAGTVPFADLPAVSDALIRAFARQFADLPESTRRVLCVVAAEPTGRADVVARALAELDEPFAALEAAEAIGLLAQLDGRLVFDHPMRRVVAYAALALPSRRAAHRALAAAWSGSGDASERLRHLVAGAVGPDDALADDLQLLADHLVRAGRPRDAVDAWRHAAELSVDSARAERRRQSLASLVRALDESTGHGPTGPLALLTKAELRVARVIAEGLSNRQASERLFLSMKTIDSHLQTIFRKLSVNTRAQLAVVVTRYDAPPEGVR